MRNTQSDPTLYPNPEKGERADLQARDRKTAALNRIQSRGGVGYQGEGQPLQKKEPETVAARLFGFRVQYGTRDVHAREPWGSIPEPVPSMRAACTLSRPGMVAVFAPSICTLPTSEASTVFALDPAWQSHTYASPLDVTATAVNKTPSGPANAPTLTTESSVFSKPAAMDS